MCRSRFTCTRQPDRYDVQPESQARVAIVTRQPDRYDVQPESQALLLCRRCTDPHVSLHRLPTKEHHQLGTATPRPPNSHNQGWTGHRAYRAMPEGPMHTVVGRNGRREEISRTSRRNSLFTAAPPPRQQSRSPPPVGGRSCGCQGRIWFPVQPWSQHSPQQSTHT